MDALAALLTRERLLVELVVFKLVELRQLLLAGETRFLGWAAEEVERSTAAVRTAEVERAVLVQSLADARGLGDEPTLAALVADAPEPWRTLLADAHAGLRSSTDEVSSLLATTRRLAEAGSRSLADTLSRVDGSDLAEARSPWDPPAQRSRVEQHL